jgi:predicted acyltransferase
MTIAAPVPSGGEGKRILSVDVLRGVTIAFMILVNDPGDWSHVFPQLDHSAWNGFTLTDLVFPMFLFLVGASTVFSMEARERRGNCKKTLTGRIFWRALKLFLLGMVLALLPLFHWHTMRIYGVLTRIALCYLACGLVLLATRRVGVLLAVVGAILIGYWVLLRWVPVPGLGWPGRDFPVLDKDLNLTAWIDRGVSAWTLKWLHTGVLYGGTHDPEGLLSTLPAVGTTLLGAVAGLWVRRGRVGLVAAGVFGVVAGSVWAYSFPINKNLWTSSYVLLSAGLSAICLAACSWLVDDRVQPWPRWLRWGTWPWFVFGANAIVAYATSEMVVKVMMVGGPPSPWAMVYREGFARGRSTEWSSLAFAVMFVGVCFLPNWWLWREKVFLKI